MIIITFESSKADARIGLAIDKLQLQVLQLQQIDEVKALQYLPHITELKMLLIKMFQSRRDRSSTRTSHRDQNEIYNDGPIIRNPDKPCAVTGFVNPFAARLVSRKCAKRFAIPVKQVKNPANTILLLTELKQAYENFEWCFDERGTIRILYRYTRAYGYLEPASVHVVPECEGGPGVKFIRIALRNALYQAKMRCQACWEVWA